MQIADIGELFITGLSGPVLTSAEAELLQKLRPGGIILFRHNILPVAADGMADNWVPALKELIARCREAAGREGLLVSIDHEGGRVHRLRAPATHFPAARHWPSEAEEVGRAMAAELRTLGFNLIFAPVVDTLTEQKNTVIGDRSFGTEPPEVAAPARRFLTGLHEAGLLGCIKHFPGHGGTVADSHHELPVCTLSKHSLWQRELVPFRELILTGVELVMTAHVRYTALDDEYPATLSSKITTTLLREELGYHGAVVTDDLEMKALALYSPEERAVLAFAAGADLLLEAFPEDKEALLRCLRMAHALRDGCSSGALSRTELVRRLERVKKLRSLGAGYMQSVRAKEDMLGIPSHTALCEKLRARADATSSRA